MSLFGDFEHAAGANTSIKLDSFVVLLTQRMPYLSSNVPVELKGASSTSTSTAPAGSIATFSESSSRILLPSSSPIELVLFESIFRSQPLEKDGTLGFASFATIMHILLKTALEDRFSFLYGVFFSASPSGCSVDGFYSLLRALYRLAYNGKGSFFVNEPRLRKFADYVFTKLEAGPFDALSLDEIKALVLEPGLLQECWGQVLSGADR